MRTFFQWTRLQSQEQSEIVNSGSLLLSPFTTIVTGSNRIALLVKDTRGSLYVNDYLITDDLQLSGLIDAGDIAIAIGFYTGDEVDGESTRYEGFTVQSLTDGATPVLIPAP